MKIFTLVHTLIIIIIIIIIIIMPMISAIDNELSFDGGNFRLKATLAMPYASIVEPIDVWVQNTGSEVRQRVDFYDGINTYYFLPNKTIEIVPSDYTMQCLTSSSDGEILSFFPDLSSYIELGKKTVRNIECVHLQLVKKIEAKVNTYNFYYDPKHNLPIEFHFKGFNVLAGSHFDEYVFSYLEYEQINGTFHPNVWSKQSDFQCHSMPDSFTGGIEGARVVGKMFGEALHNHIDTQFENFKHTHSKTYSSLYEHDERHTTFRHNLHYIYSRNRGRIGTMRLVVNTMADWNQQQMRFLHPMKKRYSRGETSFEHPSPDPLLSLPKFFDWRPLGAVSWVKDQGNCGSCWSFGSSEAIEGAMFLHTGTMTNLSSQALVDCSWRYGNNGCDGGLDYQAYQFVIENGGLPTQESYPYTMADGFCHVQDRKQVARVKSWANVVARDERALKHALITQGPISIALDASLRSLSFYGSGVYYDADCKSGLEDLDHAVLLVGYGTENGDDYWIVKNSWSSHWGNEGYVKISTRNDCGVTTQPTFVMIEKQTTIVVDDKHDSVPIATM